MTNEENQELVERCEQKIKELSKVQFGIMHKDKLDLLIYCQALAALTAQPIELPHRYSCEGYHIDEAYLVEDEDGYCFDRDEVIEKLRQQGYEVKE